MAREERPQVFPAHVQMGIIVTVTGLLYLFFGISGEALLGHATFYIIMFIIAIIGSLFVFKGEAGDKLHFTTKYVPMVNVIFYGVVMGLMMATIETFTSGGTIFVQQVTMPTQSFMQGASGLSNMTTAIVFLGIYSFITANAEETLTRGFFNSLAEEYSSSKTTLYLSKYVLVPLIFSLLHFFMWTSIGLTNIGGFIWIFLILYHYVFGVVCQISMDFTGSIYTPIAIHTIYNSVKMMIAVGIIAVGV